MMHPEIHEIPRAIANFSNGTMAWALPNGRPGEPSGGWIALYFVTISAGRDELTGQRTSMNLAV